MSTATVETETSYTGARPPGAYVVREPSPSGIDWSRWYLTDEEDMGQSCEQHLNIRALDSSLHVLAEERDWHDVYIGCDQFFGWRPDHPLVRVSPDVYLLDDPPERPFPKMWETWLPGRRPPRFVIEIVSEKWRKDYDDGPAKYAQLGTTELVIYDEDAAVGAVPQRSERVALQVYRREADGAFVRAYSGAGPAYSAELKIWLVSIRAGKAATLRLARDASGSELVPTLDEAIETANLRARLEVQRREESEQRSSQERLLREQAEQRLAELQAEVAAMRRTTAG